MGIEKKLFLASTDTIVGIGGPINEETKKAINRLKERDENQEIVIAVGTMEQARKFKGWNAKAAKLAKMYWPGPITLVISPKLALRMPGCPELMELLKKEGPCYLTSANKTKQRPLLFHDAVKKFPTITKHYDYCYGSGMASSMIDVNTSEVIR